ncbi:MAG: radical SAM protein [Cetobacterium sp.]|uniref:radical SAM protein n=1 Tax=Cetobacterium sp. TaxID=2071632 RepID=UPI003F2C1446
MEFWKILRVLTTNKCNYQCIYCHNEGQEIKEKSQILSFEDFKKIMKGIIRTPINEIRFSGGEPLMNRDTLEMIEWVNENTDLEVGLATNGSLIDEKIAKRLEKTRVLITVHLPGVENEAYKKVTKKDWDRFKEGISWMDKYNLDYSFNYVLSPESFENLDEVLEFVGERKKRIKLLPYVEDKFLNLSEKLIEDVHKKLDKITFEKRDDRKSGITWWKMNNGGEVKLLDTPCYSKNINTCKNYGEVRLLPDLKLQKCIFNPEVITIDNIENIEEILKKSWDTFNSCYRGEDK